MEKVVVIGVGRIGLCFALNLERSGYDVLGIDTDSEYVRTINDRSLRSPEPGVESALQTAQHLKISDRLEALLDFSTSLIFIAVPTPSLANGNYDHSILDNLLSSLYTLGKAPERQELIIMSTTLPGYCDSKAQEALTYNYFISYNPEFIAQGRILHDQQYPDQLLIGEADSIAGERIEAVYQKICLNSPVYHRLNRIGAEIAKLATNCFLTTKISFANAIGDLATSAGADPNKVLKAIGSDSRIGEKYLGYGFGFGGPCFPRDNKALNYFAQLLNYKLHHTEAVDEANQYHLNYQVEQYLRTYGKDEIISFYSVTYKPDTNILEESQQLELALRLSLAGRKVCIHENRYIIEELRRLYGEAFEYRIKQ
jgi:UDPglucose 6-dehydrogenase